MPNTASAELSFSGPRPPNADEQVGHEIITSRVEVMRASLPHTPHDFLVEGPARSDRDHDQLRGRAGQPVNRLVLPEQVHPLAIPRRTRPDITMAGTW
jgi:hypothetical protein